MLLILRFTIAIVKLFLFPHTLFPSSEVPFHNIPSSYVPPTPPTLFLYPPPSSSSLLLRLLNSAPLAAQLQPQNTSFADSLMVTWGKVVMMLETIANHHKSTVSVFLSHSSTAPTSPPSRPLVTSFTSRSVSLSWTAPRPSSHAPRTILGYLIISQCTVRVQSSLTVLRPSTQCQTSVPSLCTPSRYRSLPRLPSHITTNCAGCQ